VAVGRDGTIKTADVGQFELRLSGNERTLLDAINRPEALEDAEMP